MSASQRRLAILAAVSALVAVGALSVAATTLLTKPKSGPVGAAEQGSTVATTTSEAHLEAASTSTIAATQVSDSEDLDDLLAEVDRVTAALVEEYELGLPLAVADSAIDVAIFELQSELDRDYSTRDCERLRAALLEAGRAQVLFERFVDPIRDDLKEIQDELRRTSWSYSGDAADRLIEASNKVGRARLQILRSADEIAGAESQSGAEVYLSLVC